MNHRTLEREVEVLQVIGKVSSQKNCDFAENKYVGRMLLFIKLKGAIDFLALACSSRQLFEKFGMNIIIPLLLRRSRSLIRITSLPIEVVMESMWFGGTVHSVYFSATDIAKSSASLQSIS